MKKMKRAHNGRERGDGYDAITHKLRNAATAPGGITHAVIYTHVASRRKCARWAAGEVEAEGLLLQPVADDCFDWPQA